MSEAGNLKRLTELAGIEPDYWDIWGNHHAVSDASKRALLGALGIAAADDAAVRASIGILEEDPWRRPLPPVVVVREGERPSFPVVMPADHAALDVRCEVAEETGARHIVSLRPAAASPVDARVVDGRHLRRWIVELPITLPLGYHRVRLPTLGDDTMSLVVTPERCHLPRRLADGGKTWGITAHLYTLRSERNWGVGDFTDLADLVDVCAGLGGSLIGLNPLHALFTRHPEFASPYSPSSRVFLNIIYLDVEAIADFGECKPARRLVESVAEDLAALRRLAVVKYRAVLPLKMKVLALLHRSFRRRHRDDDRARDFERFRTEGGERFRRFALFEALSERFDGAPWPSWPEPYRQPDSPQVAAFARRRHVRVEFFEYLQWQADLQLAAVARRCEERDLPIGLYGDLAIGAAANGADAWSAQDVVVHRASVGAPPDPFNMLGQDWGTPPLHPLTLRHMAYEPFIAIVRANMRHNGALRIDHVMGLFHLFWIPAGEKAAAGGYVRYPFDDLLGILALESHRHRCLVIGEDLGTVPEGFRERMAAMNVLSYKVLYFEKDGDRFKRPAEYPKLALACVATHDLATLPGFWTAADIDLKEQLRLYPSPEDAASERGARRHDRALLLSALAAEGMLPAGIDLNGADQASLTPELAVAVHGYLARSPACVLMVQIDDLMEQPEQLNLPGTVDERPNWRRRLPFPAERLPATPLVRALRPALADRNGPAT
ncbi:MAG: 4-alpha-glucanotransferase [Rhodospirillales bacterium]